MKKAAIITKLFALSIVFSAAGLLSSCSANKENLKRESSVIHPEWSRDAVIYEVNIRQFTPEGTFKAFEQHLPRLKELGADILWLMPVHPIGIKNRKGSLGSYYSVRDYLGINPEFGTMEDFRELVRKAHEQGMKVIIDWVANHTSWDNNLITEHPDWYTRDSTGNILLPDPVWTDVADLDYSKEGLREYMKNAMIFWIRETDIDGFRCDVADMVPGVFWNKAVPEIRKIKPVFMLAECETPEVHDTAFDMTYSFELYNLMNDIASGKKNANSLDSLWLEEDTVYAADAYRMRFTSNHDKNSDEGSEYERLGNAAETFAVLTFTVPGMPLIYSGQEAALKKRLKFFDKDTIDWDNYMLSSFYSTLSRLKKENIALWNGTAGGPVKRLHNKKNKEIYAFLREKEDNRILVILNLTPESLNADIFDHAMLGSYTDVFTGKSIRIEDELIIPLKPWEYRILVKK